jgi:hypothetical protein
VVSLRWGLVLGVAAAIAAGAVATSAFSRSSEPARAWPSGCPTLHPVSGNFRPVKLAVAARAVQEQIPRVFKHLTSMGSPAWPHASIAALVSTGGTPVNPESWPPPLEGVAHYAAIATRACGKAVADASYVAFINFPACQMPCSAGFAFVTRTRRGWVLWRSYR